MTPLAAAKVPQLNARIFHPLARYLREQVSPAALKAVVAAGRLEDTALDGRSLWITLEQGEALLAEARTLFEDDESFRAACAYKLAAGYGAMRLVLWATSPHTVYMHAMKTMHLVCNYGTIEVVSSTRTGMHAQYRATAPESRLLCLSRQAATAALPTFFGLPPAYLREESCVSRGDPYCDYHLRWFDQKRWYPSALGLLAGAASFGALSAWTNGIDLGGVALPLLGASLGYIFENQRTGAANLAVREEVTDALRDLSREETEARQELLELQERQRDWTRMLEVDAADRSAQMQRVADSLHQLQEQRDTKIRGYSHDLRNPLTVIRAAVEYFRPYGGAEGDAVLADLDASIEQMRRLLEDLMTMVTQKSPMAQLTPQRLEVAALTDRLRRRLRALVQSKDIRATVFKTREAPDHIDADPVLFDRVVDNLLTNAAKYTEHGSIIVEVDGTTEFFTLKVSDTGRGIPHEQLEHAFRPDGSDRTQRVNDSYGVGLSVVVELLNQVGGRLEVMSKPASGTTFWVHFPLAAPAGIKSRPVEAERPIENYKDVLLRVVTIRKSKAS